MQNRNDILTYKQGASWADRFRYIKAIIYPLTALGASLYTVDIFGQWGSGLLVYGFAGIWITGLLASIFTSNSVVKQLDGVIYQIWTYVATLLFLRWILTITAGVSSEMLSASFEQSISIQSSNISSIIQNFLNFSAVLMPFSFIVLNVKSVFAFRSKSKQGKAYKQLMGVANNSNQR